MIFQATADWILDKSPHTGQQKTSTIRLAKKTHQFFFENGSGQIPGCVGDITAINFSDGSPAYPRVRHVQDALPSGGVRTLYELHRRIAIQPGRGKPGVGFIIPWRIEFCIPADMTLEQLHKDGFDTRDRFEAVWEKLHGKNTLEHLCWYLQFYQDITTEEKDHV